MLRLRARLHEYEEKPREGEKESSSRALKLLQSLTRRNSFESVPVKFCLKTSDDANFNYRDPLFSP
jgi:hypothetical protein